MRGLPRRVPDGERRARAGGRPRLSRQRAATAPPLCVCAPNAFKGTLSAARAAAALAAGVTDAGWRALAVPVADGGDGTLDVLLHAAGDGARTDRVVVTGPLGGRRTARLGWLTGGVAVVEMAEAAGLRLLRPGHLAPLAATSRGAGDLIVAALDRGAHRVVVGVGGSASTDGGAGLLAALGARLLDGSGRPVAPGGAGLADLAAVDLTPLDRRLRNVSLEVAVDVDSPLLGPSGAAAVFGPQKGATPVEVHLLDAGLARFAALLERATGRTGVAASPGAGAAGGAGFALAAIGARLVGGAALVCDLAGLDGALRGARLVITGEGRLDEQTSAGKAPAEVARRARGAGIPCVAVAGSVAGGTETFDGAIALDSIGADPRRNAVSLLRRTARTAVRSWPASGGGAHP